MILLLCLLLSKAVVWANTTGCSAGNDIIFWLISQATKHLKNTFRRQNVSESIAFGYEVSKNSKWIILIFYISVSLSPGIRDIAKNTKKNKSSINKYFVHPPISRIFMFELWKFVWCSIMALIEGHFALQNMKLPRKNIFSSNSLEFKR